MCSQIHSGKWHICSISSLYNTLPLAGHLSWSGTARCPMASAPWTPTAMPGTRARTRSSAMPATCWATSCSIRSASPATASWLCSAWRLCHRIDGKSVMSAGEQEIERERWRGGLTWRWSAYCLHVLYWFGINFLWCLPHSHHMRTLLITVIVAVAVTLAVTVAVTATTTTTVNWSSTRPRSTPSI